MIEVCLKYAAAAQVCQTLTEADGSSLNKQWFEFELTLHNIHSAATWRRWHNDKKVWSGSDHNEKKVWSDKLKMAFNSRPPHMRTILKDWENKCIVATKQHRGVHKDTLHHPQNTNSLSDTGNNTTHMVFEGEPAVKLHAKNVKVGASKNINPSQDKVTIRRVDSPFVKRALGSIGMYCGGWATLKMGRNGEPWCLWDRPPALWWIITVRGVGCRYMMESG